jgi:polysaccharide pyruvyl transferase WcaK-like protein
MITDKPLAGTKPPSFALISPSGYGNLGDAAIVDTVIEQIRLRYPDARIIALTLNPEDTLQRHGVEASTLMGFSRPGYGIMESNDQPRTDALTSAEVSKRANHMPAPSARTAIIRLLAIASRPLRRRLRPLKAEALHIRNSLELLKTTDTLVVCGGGQLDDYWGGAWGHPYVLFRWSILARRVGTTIVALGIGYGTLRNALSRFFIRRFLSNADFRSYRDSRSRDLVGAPNITQGDTVGPDLAFALNVEAYAPTKKSTAEKFHIAVSPMAWLDPRVWPEKSQAGYDRYVSLLADFVNTLVRSGHLVSLFATDGMDELTISDVMARLRHDSPPEARVIQLPAMGSVKNLLSFFAKVDLVVASRLHGTLLSCLMAVPTVALSYERKVATLMRELNLSDYCHDLSDIDLNGISALTNSALNNRQAIKAGLRERVAENRRLLDIQFETVFGPAGIGSKNKGK